MNCKYCHLKTHFIDKCPTIICKNCKDIGHPQWLCKDKKYLNNSNNSNNNNNNNNNNNKTKTKSINLDKKYEFIDEIKKKPIENQIIKNISYYIKLENESWSNIAN